jgi:hypothetical protein
MLREDYFRCRKDAEKRAIMNRGPTDLVQQIRGKLLALCRSGSTHFRGFPFERRRTRGKPPFSSKNSTPGSLKRAAYD